MLLQDSLGLHRDVVILYLLLVSGRRRACDGWNCKSCSEDRLAIVAGIAVALSVSAFAKESGAKHVAVGTITSIDANQVVITEKVKGKTNR
jgi:hypothetical protein